MGLHNRQRRRQKKNRREHQRQAARSGGRAERGGWTSTSQGIPAATAIWEAAEATYHERGDAVEAVELLVLGSSICGGRGAVARDLHRELQDWIRTTAAANWLPSEVVRQVRRKIGARGAHIAGATIRRVWQLRGSAAGAAWADEASGIATPDWRLDERDETWASDVAVAVKLVGLLSHLPVLPECRGGDDPTNRSTGSSAKARVLEKVRHLLWKAESTEFPEEAEACTAKAQELLTRYSIDRAALGAKDPARRRSSAAVRRIWLADPYVPAKAQLLDRVATANRCRSVIMEIVGLAVVAGHDDDLDTVETLFTSLLVQATGQMTAAGSKTDYFGRSRTRAFRQSFLVAFAVRIGQRLREAGEASVVEGIAVHGDDLLPVLASRSSAADEAIGEMFGELGACYVAATDDEGWRAGTVAADHAQLSLHSEISEGAA